MRIGFVGLGMMGSPMAHLLHAAGHTLVVKDAVPDVQAGFLDAHPGAEVATGAADFADCEVLVTMLPNSDIVDRVIDEIAPALRRGATVVEMSSADPVRTRALAARLSERGVILVDAPVSGGVKKAVAGTLAIMVGGEAAAFERLRPVLSVVGQSLTHVGPVGAGHALKALNNYVSAAALIATVEAIHAGVAFGIDAATIVNVINTSTGRNNTTENKAHQYMLNGAFNSGFSLALQAKDVGIAVALGGAVGQPMRLARQVDAITTQASETLGSGADHTELYTFAGQP